MPDGDALDGYFYPTFTLTIDSYGKIDLLLNAVNGPRMQCRSRLVGCTSHLDLHVCRMSIKP